MATLVRPGRPLSTRIQRAYRLEMAGRTVVLLLLLLALTGLVVFYLGVITGKGLRDPNQPMLADATAPAATEAKPAALPGAQPTALNHALQAPNGQIEGLKKEGDTANQQTQQLLSRAKQELVLDEVRDKGAPPAAGNLAPPAPAAKTAAQPAPKTPAHPAATAQHATQKKPAAVRAPAPPAAAESDGFFTVQVFSSPQQQHAQDILADLKKKGFPAYMNQFQAADKRTWYRVRVGKSTRSEADALATKIRGSTTNLEPRVMKQ